MYSGPGPGGQPGRAGPGCPRGVPRILRASTPGLPGCGMCVRGRLNLKPCCGRVRPENALPPTFTPRIALRGSRDSRWKADYSPMPTVSFARLERARAAVRIAARRPEFPGILLPPVTKSAKNRPPPPATPLRAACPPTPQRPMHAGGRGARPATARRRARRQARPRQVLSDCRSDRLPAGRRPIARRRHRTRAGGTRKKLPNSVKPRTWSLWCVHLDLDTVENRFFLSVCRPVSLFPFIAELPTPAWAAPAGKSSHRRRRGWRAHRHQHPLHPARSRACAVEASTDRGEFSIWEGTVLVTLSLPVNRSCTPTEGVSAPTDG
eukprot:gene7907-biopygen10600